MKNFLQGTILASKAFIISVVALAVAGVVTVAVVHALDDHRHGVAHVVDKMERELNLSGAQRAQVETALNDALLQFRNARESRLDAVTALLNQPQLTSEDARRAIDAHLAERKTVVADAFAQVHAILTPSQRAELAAWVQARMDDDWFHHHRHRRHHHGRGHHHWLH